MDPIVILMLCSAVILVVRIICQTMVDLRIPPEQPEIFSEFTAVTGVNLVKNEDDDEYILNVQSTSFTVGVVNGVLVMNAHPLHPPHAKQPSTS